MGRKKKADKPAGGKHTTPRTPVQMPDEWLAIARRRAGASRMPTSWYLISLLLKDAQEAGITDLPRPPWEKQDKAADKP